MLSLRLFFLATIVKFFVSFKWDVNDIIETDNTLTISEQYLFASHHGPLLSDVSTIISTDVEILESTIRNHTAEGSYVAYAVYMMKDVSNHYSVRLEGMCQYPYDLPIESNTFAKNIMIEAIPFEYKSSKPISTGGGSIQMTYQWGAKLQRNYHVVEQGWYNAVFQYCSTTVGRRQQQGLDNSAVRNLQTDGDSPTAAPSAKPSAAPTIAPTAAVTAAPTVAITTAPTAAPSAKPSSKPTAAVTAAPSAKPSAAPTAAVTAAPSAKPSAAPTAAVTAAPSAKPSSKPTTAVTAAPSAKPSAAPTAAVTAAPSAAPSAKPSSKPTAAGGINDGSNEANGEDDDELIYEPDELIDYIHVKGYVGFKNPYGYVPAPLFGILPFQAALLVAYTLLAIVFLSYMLYFKESTLMLHYAIFCVLALATTEAIAWFIAYFLANWSGDPFCCPYSPAVIASLILQVTRQTTARTLFLVVSLGYGIVRPKLIQQEWCLVGGATVLYFISALFAQITDIEMVADQHHSVVSTADDSSNQEAQSNFTYLQIPVIVEAVMNIIFLLWIYVSLLSTIRVLTEFQQHFKLQLYTKLVNIIFFFVLIVTCILVLIILGQLHFFTWPWEMNWIQLVIWQGLYFGIIQSLCWVCLPSDNSRYLSYSSQLPTQDPDWNDQETEDGDEFDNIRGDDDWFTAEIHNPMKGKGNAINAPNNRVSNTRASAMEDGDDDDFEMVMSGRDRGYNSLPDAGDH